jgi:hypothetical protein
VSYIRHKSGFVQHSVFYAVNSDMWFNNTQRTHTCISIAKMSMLRRHNVMLGVHSSVFLRSIQEVLQLYGLRGLEYWFDRELRIGE